MTPVEVVDQQLIAYHARDIIAFAQTYSPNVRIWEAGQHGPAMVGRDAIIAHYEAVTFRRDGLHAEIASRIAVGNKVVDHELTTWDGLDSPLSSIVIYEVLNDLIENVWFFDTQAQTL